jgi:hypothetical protein
MPVVDDKVRMPRTSVDTNVIDYDQTGRNMCVGSKLSFNWFAGDSSFDCDTPTRLSRKRYNKLAHNEIPNKKTVLSSQPHVKSPKPIVTVVDSAYSSAQDSASSKLLKPMYTKLRRSVSASTIDDLRPVFVPMESAIHASQQQLLTPKTVVTQ